MLGDSSVNYCFQGQEWSWTVSISNNRRQRKIVTVSSVVWLICGIYLQSINDCWDYICAVSSPLETRKKSTVKHNRLMKKIVFQAFDFHVLDLAGCTSAWISPSADWLKCKAEPLGYSGCVNTLSVCQHPCCSSEAEEKPSDSMKALPFHTPSGTTGPPAKYLQHKLVCLFQKVGDFTGSATARWS